MSPSRTPQVVNLHPPKTPPAPTPLPGAERVRLSEQTADGSLRVLNNNGDAYLCDMLDNGGGPLALHPGDLLLALPPDNTGRGVVLGRVGPWRAPQPQARLTLEATEVLTLKCGEVSIDLRAADGKLMLRGEDLLLRAKGSQRLRAGSVAIN
jgi:hypothetical protein